jgi:hypothetical protein
MASSKIEDLSSKLEYATAEIFQRHGFGVLQGSYVDDRETGKRREVDVEAWKVVEWKKRGPIRVDCVAECKKSSKPWVFFTTERARVAPSVCVARTLGSELGTSAMWCLAGHEELAKLPTFATPSRPAFSGRQAWSGENDVVYNALRSVVAATRTISEQLDSLPHNRGTIPEGGGVGFPLIVLDGELFEAHPDEMGKIRVRPADSVRVHWRGAPSWPVHVTVDVVVLGALDKYVASLARDVDVIIRLLKQAFDCISDAAALGDRSKVLMTKGPRGTIGLPRLLRDIPEGSADPSSSSPPKRRRKRNDIP